MCSSDLSVLLLLRLGVSGSSIICVDGKAITTPFVTAAGCRLEYGGYVCHSFSLGGCHALTKGLYLFTLAASSARYSITGECAPLPCLQS